MTAVPHRMRVICAITAAVVVAVMLVIALFLKHETVGVVSFHGADQFAMAGIGLVLGAGILFLGRSKVQADTDAVTVQNVIGRYELPWSVVDAVRFERGSPWASLRLVTGEEISVIAVQAADGERAVAAIDGLRALLAAAHPAPSGPTGPPLLYGE